MSKESLKPAYCKIFGKILKILIIPTLLTSFFAAKTSGTLMAQTIDRVIPKVTWSRPIGLPFDSVGHPYHRTNIDDGYWQGAPLGGMGAGSIGRTYRGDFARWHLKVGFHKYGTVWGNQFCVWQKPQGSPKGVAKVLYAGSKPRVLKSWDWTYPVGAGTYYALYPRSWFDYRYEKFPVHLICEQFSPVIPHNYRESSYPVAVFVWYAENTSDQECTVSILFSWTNMLGWFRDMDRRLNRSFNTGNFNRYWEGPIRLEEGTAVMKGILFDREREGPVREDWDGQMMIATIELPGWEVTYHTTMSARSKGDDIWKPFSRRGRLKNKSSELRARPQQPLLGAIAVTTTLKPGEIREIPFVLVWDLPVMTFGEGRKWYRRYTEFFGTDGQNAPKIAQEALRHYKAWRRQIIQWQQPLIEDESVPEWYRMMLFNELYYLVDGGTAWENGEVGKKAPPSHNFSLLECFDYPFYSTLDVRFLGSFPLALFWPEIEKQVMRQFARTVPLEDTTQVVIGWDRSIAPRKIKGVLPHDLGNPIEDPWYRINNFTWQNVSGWKDLNPKFVLQVYRDFVLTGSKDIAFLRDCWPAVQEALAKMEDFDTDGDGLPENSGYPDQTYDTWTMSGTSAYCGGLYLAALEAAEQMAKILGDHTKARHYRARLRQAQPAFVRKLWNGTYYDFDTQSPYRKVIMSEQLAGQWYARLCGLPDIVPPEHIRSVCRTIFEHNVQKFGGGRMGPINGIFPNGERLRGRKWNMPSHTQAVEVWTGVAFAVASFLLQNGFKEEAFQTAWGVYNVVYRKRGYWFRTPEAYTEDGNYRASMYMRPLSIWAMEVARKQQE